MNTKEHLVVITAQLAFALPAEIDPENVYDYANMMLIPLQRYEDEPKKWDLIDYTLELAGISPTPLSAWSKDEGFEMPGTPEPIHNHLRVVGRVAHGENDAVAYQHMTVSAAKAQFTAEMMEDVYMAVDDHANYEPPEVFIDAVFVSETPILVGEAS